MFIIASNLFNSSLPVFTLEIVGGAMMLFGLVSYLKHSNVKAQLIAKDTIIETNEQTIAAFEDRLDSLDAKVKDLETKLDEAETKNDSLISELRDWEQKYASLENFAAPQLGQQLLDMFSQQEQVLNRIVALLDSIEKRMDAIENKASSK